MSDVLVIAAHPDDEALGCGATIARHAAAGETVHILFVADGETARPGTGDEDVSRREASACEAARILGAGKPEFLRFPDNRLDGQILLDIVAAIEKVVEQHGPRIIYTHHGGDMNVDHRVVHQAVLTACRPLPGSSMDAIYAFEIPSSTEWGGSAFGPPFVPVHFVDVAGHVAKKRNALAAYSGEMRAFPHPRSAEAIDALEKVRGAAAGVRAAEAFMLVRSVSRRD